MGGGSKLQRVHGWLRQGRQARVHGGQFARLARVGQALLHARLATLSTREREVLDLILAGKMNKVVADKLGISMRTVKSTARISSTRCRSRRRWCWPRK